MIPRLFACMFVLIASPVQAECPQLLVERYADHVQVRFLEFPLNPETRYYLLAGDENKQPIAPASLDAAGAYALPYHTIWIYLVIATQDLTEYAAYRIRGDDNSKASTFFHQRLPMELSPDRLDGFPDFAEICSLRL